MCVCVCVTVGSTVHKRYCVECRYICPILTQQLKEL